MVQKSNRKRRRGPAGANTPATQAATDRYQKFLPEWMRGNGAPVRPPRPRRAKQNRPPGGYTPGKFAVGE